MEIVEFLGGTAIALSVIAWLIKSLASHFLGKDIETFKARIKYESEHSNHLLLQKISLYKDVSNPVIELVVTALHNGALTKEDLKLFDKQRLSTTALLAMFAPVNVFNDYSHMIDYIYDAVEGKEEWSFKVFREKALVFLSNVRRDIGLYEDSIEYIGTR